MTRSNRERVHWPKPNAGTRCLTPRAGRKEHVFFRRWMAACQAAFLLTASIMRNATEIRNGSFRFGDRRKIRRSLGQLTHLQDPCTGRCPLQRSTRLIIPHGKHHFGAPANRSADTQQELLCILHCIFDFSRTNFVTYAIVLGCRHEQFFGLQRSRC